MPTPPDPTLVGVISHALVVAYPMSPCHLSLAIYIRPALVVHRVGLMMPDLALPSLDPALSGSGSGNVDGGRDLFSCTSRWGRENGWRGGCKWSGNNGEAIWWWESVQAAIATKMQRGLGGGGWLGDGRDKGGGKIRGLSWVGFCCLNRSEDWGYFDLRNKLYKMKLTSLILKYSNPKGN